MYDKLDALIVDRINTASGATFLELEHNKAISLEAHLLAEQLKRDAYRVIDGRLQVLRKRGAIRFDRPVWRLAKDAEARG